MTSQEIREAIRVILGDDDPTNERFVDQQLNTFISVALGRLSRRIALPIGMASGVFVPVGSGTLGMGANADPISSDLIILQSVCLVSSRERYNAVQKGVRVKQDENEVDTSVGLQAFNDAVAGVGGACAELEKALILASMGATAANATNVWSGNSNLYEDIDHNGQSYERLYGPYQNSFQDRFRFGGGPPLDDLYRYVNG